MEPIFILNTETRELFIKGRLTKVFRKNNKDFRLLRVLIQAKELGVERDLDYLYREGLRIEPQGGKDKILRTCICRVRKLLGDHCTHGLLEDGWDFLGQLGNSYGFKVPVKLVGAF